ncbi:hypothetical protein LIER_14686 [Lithospermum erythrorhizon]|uniref:Uncharacterized protein n=1 Tax=Lithospermum erythrorhizon TaxID=34254 RepID=A0AAV3Q462_LITER
MESNVDTSAINVSDTQNVHVMVPGGGFGLTNGVILPPFVHAAVVPAVPASRSGGTGVVPPAFATTVTLPPQPPNVPVMQKNDQPR